MSETLVAHARSVVDNLRSPRARRYFTDGLISAGIGWASFAAAATSGLPSAMRVLAFTVAVFALYRALSFIHELFHHKQLESFRWAWHFTVGVPLLLPLLLYLPIHQAHHSGLVYGTSRDGEYEQFNGRRSSMIWRLVLLNFALPLALWLRFALLTPLGAVLPFVRKEVIPSFVHLSLRLPFKAPAMRASAASEAKKIEWLCAVWAWMLMVGLLSGYHKTIGIWVIVMIAVATLNTMRALCSTHLYVEHDEGRDTLDQLVDSLNIDGGGLWTEILCPVGLRYHALHHLAPYLPYHALPEAHRRLLRELPEDSAYHRVTVSNTREGWRRLVAATEGSLRTPAPGVTSS